MDYFVVYLIKSKRFLALPKNWIEHPILGQESKVFFSADKNILPDFNSRIGYYVNNDANACYEAYVYKAFGSWDAAERFALNKRVTPPIQYKTLQKFDYEPGHTPVDFMEISDDMVDLHVRFLVKFLCLICFDFKSKFNIVNL